MWQLPCAEKHAMIRCHLTVSDHELLFLTCYMFSVETGLHQLNVQCLQHINDILCLTVNICLSFGSFSIDNTDVRCAKWSFSSQIKSGTGSLHKITDVMFMFMHLADAFIQSDLQMKID